MISFDFSMTPVYAHMHHQINDLYNDFRICHDGTVGQINNDFIDLYGRSDCALFYYEFPQLCYSEIFLVIDWINNYSIALSGKNVQCSKVNTNENLWREIVYYMVHNFINGDTLITIG